MSTPPTQPEPPTAAAEFRPLIGITMGDPAGIGPEVVVKALADAELRHRARFIIFGGDEPLGFAADLAEVNPYWFRLPHEQVGPVETGVVVADFDEFGLVNPRSHGPTVEGGQASMRYLEAAAERLAAGNLDALVTAPISKVSWKLAGYRFPGHTEMLAKRFRTRRYVMMLAGGRLRVALASIHLPLFELRNCFTIGLVHTPIDLLHQALRDWYDLPAPRIAVCGLNPHASDEGRFGDEEHRIIEPAMTMARESGIDVRGPYPADTLFGRAIAGEFDGVVAMYHDQGLIPIKLHAFGRAVNVTLGLPVIRTSVDHGTAFDIAGRNRADPGSMAEAIRLACHLAIRQRAARQSSRS